jgi:phosphodiesterase/alkaline phosphatase D-like protein
MRREMTTRRAREPNGGRPCGTAAPTRAVLALALLAVAASACGGVPQPVLYPPGAQPVEWVWSGGVTTTGATVRAKIGVGASEARLLVSRAGDTGGEPIALAPAEGPSLHRVVTFALSGLEPDTGYEYRVEVDGRLAPLGRGALRTFPAAGRPYEFTIAFASCATHGSTSRIFDTIRRQDPLFFVHMGDFHYYNISRPDPQLFRNAFDRVLSTPNQSALYRHVPLVYVFDDHDFGPNDATRADGTGPAAREAYTSYVPHYPLAAGTGDVDAIHHAFTVGRVRFLVTDTRSHRDPLSEPAPRTMLGERQLAWLLDEFAAAAPTHALVVWVNTVPWITKEGGCKGGAATTEGWAPYDAERRRIAEAIDEAGLTRRLVMLSGDAHMAALDDGTHSAYGREPRGFVVAHAAPLDRRATCKGGPYSHGYSQRRHQFGTLALKDDGQDIVLEIAGRDQNGDVVSGNAGRPLHLVLRCGPAGCEADRLPAPGSRRPPASR